MTRLDNEASTDKASQPRRAPENFWLEVAKTLGLSVVLALGIRTFVAEARFIPSGSMLPTLQIDDRLIVDKVTYHFKDPQRGDIVVFMPPDKAATACAVYTPSPGNLQTQAPQAPIPHPKDAYIKRIVGLPGDKVEVRTGRVLINDQPLPENYIEKSPEYQYGPKRVPEGSYLVLGDNRNNSCDSHYWDFVPRENLIGRAVVRFWPLNRLGGIDPVPSYGN